MGDDRIAPEENKRNERAREEGKKFKEEGGSYTVGQIGGGNFKLLPPFAPDGRDDGTTTNDTARGSADDDHYHKYQSRQQ